MSGKAAAFGGRMMNTVADQVLKQFADQLRGSGRRDAGRRPLRRRGGGARRAGDTAPRRRRRLRRPRRRRAS